MKKQRNKILFIFSGNAKINIEEIVNGLRPKSQYYWYVGLQEKGVDVAYFDVNLFTAFVVIRVLHYLLNRIFSSFSGIGFNLSKIVLQLKYINQYDTVFCTTDSLGLPVLALKILGIVKPDVVYQSIGLMDGWKKKQNRIMKNVLKYLLKSAKTIVCYTPSEQDLLVNILGIDKTKIVVTHAVAGVEYEFFRKFKINGGSFVLSIGRDCNRDFATFITALDNTDLHGVIVKSKNCELSCALSNNIELLQDIPYAKVLELYQNARIIVITLLNNSYSAGWIVVGEAMSLGKPIIITKVDAMNGMNDILIDRYNCMLVPSQDRELLKNAILELNADKNLRQYLGYNARQTALKINERYINTLSEVFF